MPISDLSKKAQWITFALSSGACAAINGVFAKLFVVSLPVCVVNAITDFGDVVM